MADATSAPTDSVGGYVWPMWAKNRAWRDKLSKALAHKALDIPDDEMNISNTKTGIGALGAVGIAAAAGIPSTIAAAILGYSLMGKPDAAPVAPTPSPFPSSPFDSSYEVLFYDRDGNPISVPHLSTKPKG